MTKNGKKQQKYFLSKIVITSNTWNLLTVFYFSGLFLPSMIWLRIRNPDPDMDPGTPLIPDPHRDTDSDPQHTTVIQINIVSVICYRNHSLNCSSYLCNSCQKDDKLFILNIPALIIVISSYIWIPSFKSVCEIPR
jgi:hypothetical protein